MFDEASDFSEPFEDSDSEYQPSENISETTCVGEGTTELLEEITVNREGSRNGNERKGRKRKLQPSQWKRNILKEKRARGEEYTNQRGVGVPARKQKAHCGCKKACLSKISAEDKQKILCSFNEIANQDNQDGYLAGLISATRKRTRRGGQNKRNRQFVYKYKVKNFKVKYVYTSSTVLYCR